VITLNTFQLVSKKDHKRKLDRAVTGPYGTDTRSLRYVNVYWAQYNKDLRPVCPFCGVYEARTIDYGVVPPSRQHLGKMEYVAICLLCNTAFKYYTAGIT
jgi:hypothetical protein